MDLDRLWLLRELSDRGTITEVAKATHRTPSAVSQQLKILEQEAGIQLIEHFGRGVRLTEAGEILTEGLVDVQEAYERMRSRLDDFRHESVGEVAVSIFPTAGQMIMPGVVTRLNEYPGIDLECVDNDLSETHVTELLLDYHIVLAFTANQTIPWNEPEIIVVPLLWEPIDIALSRDHELAGRTTLKPKDLVGQTWVGVPKGYPFDDLLMRVQDEAKQPAKVRHRFSDTRVVAAFVAAGHGIAFLPRYTSQPSPEDNFTLKPVEGIRSGRFIVALVRKDHAERSAVKTVLAAIRKESESLMR